MCLSLWFPRSDWALIGHVKLFIVHKGGNWLWLKLNLASLKTCGIVFLWSWNWTDFTFDLFTSGLQWEENEQLWWRFKCKKIEFDVYYGTQSCQSHPCYMCQISFLGEVPFCNFSLLFWAQFGVETCFLFCFVLFFCQWP
jgi:hypothetical protein